MDIFNSITSVFDGLFTHARLGAIVWGFLFSVGLTQWLKMPIKRYFYLRGADQGDAMTVKLSEECHKWITRTIATASAFGATLLLWPSIDGPIAYRFIWSATAGLMSPTFYVIVMRIISTRWPWLADKVSADATLVKLPPQEPPS